MKKKSLLLAIAAMSMAAVGVGTVGTFAWYSATAAVSATASATPYGLSTTTTEVSISGVTINITLTSSSNVELSRVADSKVYIGGMANGEDKVETNWTDAASDVKTAHPIVGEYTISTCAFSSTPTAGQYEALKGKKAVFDLQAQGNVVFVGSDGQTAATPKLTVNFKTADGTIDTYTITNNTFAIRTNNKDGLEYVKSAGLHASDGQIIGTATGTPASGTKGYDAESYEVKNYNGSAWVSLDPQVYLHEADKVTVDAGPVELANQ